MHDKRQLLHEQEPQDRHNMNVNLAQQFLLGLRIKLIFQSVVVGFHGRVFDVELAKLVVGDVGVHRIGACLEY